MSDFLFVSYPADTLAPEITYHEINEYVPCETGGGVTHIRVNTFYRKGEGAKKQGKGYYSQFIPVSVAPMEQGYEVNIAQVAEEHKRHDVCFLGDEGRVFSKKKLEELHGKLKKCSHYRNVMAEITARHSLVGEKQ